MIGVAIQGRDARQAVQQIIAAEEAGIPAAWATMGGAGSADMMTAYAAAAVQTERIILGTAIVQTWPRHPIVLAQQALALEELAPGRFRLGIGTGSELGVTVPYGVEWHRPLTQLREYLIAIRSLLHEGRVSFDGVHVHAHRRIATPVQTPVMASALQPRSFELCGELADGAISWMCPRSYLVEHALPALLVGAERAGRPAPPLVAHVPIAVSEDREAVRALARTSLAMYGQAPFYAAMFERAGFPNAGEGYSDELLDDLVVSGSEEAVADGLAVWLEAGVDEVLASPLVDPDDREGSISRAVAAAGRAARASA